MAEEELEEDFISFEDDDDEEVEAEELIELLDEDKTLAPEKSNKLLYILIAVFAVLAFALLGFVYYLYLQKQAEKETSQHTETIIKNIQEKKAPLVKTDAYQAQLQKAKSLFDKGEKEASLVIYEELSHFNKALAQYNIGVTALKEKKYEAAIHALSKSLHHDKLRFESTLNIAIAAFAQGDNQTFTKHLSQAITLLETKVDSPLYSYYRTIIAYYRGFYAESLVPLRHPTSNFYRPQQDALLSKLYTAFDNPNEAIKVLEKGNDDKDLLTLGLLYATQEEYTLSQKYLQKALENQPKDTLHPTLALALTYMKQGFFKKSADLINPMQQKFKDQASETYPIKVALKKALFDPVSAQKAFQKNLFFNKRNSYSLIFYFAPYQMTNPKQSIDNIHLGAQNITVNAYSPALDNLHTSGKISEANLDIIKGIKATLNEDLYVALEIFQTGISKYPSSAQLHYNLALTYAKLYNFQKAQRHFQKSAVLDTNNLTTPIFATFCATLLHQEIDKSHLAKLYDRIQDSDKKDKNTLLTLLAIAQEDILIGDSSIHQTPLDDVIAAILAQMRQENQPYKQATASLLKKLPNDIIATILHLDAREDKQDIKLYAKKIQEKLTQKNLDFTPLYTGHAFAKELYIEILNIAGLVPSAKRRFEIRLRNKGSDNLPALQALAYTDIYVQEFDQAYAIYNQLIDQHKQQDSNTLFLAAIASIGAAHHENAIALLELAKLTNEANLESRYALGILYHESQNLEGAAIQYAKIGDSGFSSRYFNFQLDKSNLKP